MQATVQCPTNRPTLQRGASSEVVRQMQQALNQRLKQYDTATSFPQQVTVTGNFGENTDILVKYIQCLAFLPADGVVGKSTWGFLCEGTASLPQLRQGSSGAMVKAVQELLDQLGLYNGAFDGAYGPKTIQAVKAFQTSRNLVADGTIAAKTWDALIRSREHVTSCYIDFIGD